MKNQHEQYSGPSSLITTRRQFLQRVGLASGVLGVGGGLATSPGMFAGVCDPPGNPTSPKPWRADCRPIRPRRPATTLDATEIQKLKDAYKAMRALDTSDPADPRGFQRQANVHCWYCGHVTGTQVHGSWQFFAWHRACLYFHERILGKMIGDMEFRLPYWDWEHPSHRKIPGAYTTPNDSTNPLHNGTRFMSPTAELPDEDVGDDVMDAALTAGNFTDFGGTSSDSGIPEGAPHGSVHVDVNGDMGAFSTAGRDPIFYAHHSNIDKMWSDWNKGASTHTNPSDPAFLNLKWNFFDENKVWRSITAAQVLNHENQLRYTYGPSKFSEMLPCIFDWIVIKVDWRVDRPLRLASADQARLRQALDRNERVRLHINGLAIPINKSAMYRLYTNADAANADAGPGSRDYLGVFPVVLNDLENRHPAKRTTTVIVKARKQMVEYLLRGAAPLQLAFVERGAKGEARRAMPARARSVHFAVPQPED